MSLQSTSPENRQSISICFIYQFFILSLSLFAITQSFSSHLAFFAQNTCLEIHISPLFPFWINVRVNKSPEMWSPSSSSVGFCAHNKKICGNCRVSPRDGLSLISSPYEVSTGIWQVLYEAGNPRWRFLLSWNILSAIVHQRGRCALLDDPCHCVIKLIISFNSLVALAVFSKNLSVPVFVACGKRKM